MTENSEMDSPSEAVSHDIYVHVVNEIVTGQSFFASVRPYAVTQAPRVTTDIRVKCSPLPEKHHWRVTMNCDVQANAVDNEHIFSSNVELETVCLVYRDPNGEPVSAEEALSSIQDDIAPFQYASLRQKMGALLGSTGFNLGLLPTMSPDTFKNLTSLEEALDSELQ